MIPTGQFELPLWLDVAAIGIFSFLGAMAAIKRHYDIIGVFALALVTGSGGILLREAVFLHGGPPIILTEPLYLRFVMGAIVFALAARRMYLNYEARFRLILQSVDALGLGLYAVYGAQKAILAGMGVAAAVLIGAVSAVGGGLLRDILTRDEPILFRPGQFYAAAAVVGAWLFVMLSPVERLGANEAALFGIVATFGVRMGSVAFDWRTVPAERISTRLFARWGSKRVDRNEG
jgi:uncharacterized membrane protein YeiH